MTKVGAFETPFIVCGVIWYRQEDYRLRKLVESLEHRVQGIVAIDGPYEGLSPILNSPESNFRAISDTAAKIGIPCWLYECEKPWRDEPSKRTALAREAYRMAQELEPSAEPWLLGLDSDEWLMDDLDAGVVAEYGHGSCILQSYRDDAETSDGGTGNKMVRLFPLTPDILWGPAHFDVRDMSIDKTYSGWDRALSNTEQPAFTVGHDLGEKVIKVEYEAYNDARRLETEGKMMRIVESYAAGQERLVIRMDNEQISAHEWKVGQTIRINGQMLGIEEEQGWVEVKGIVPVDGDAPISDIICEMITESQAERIAKAEHAARLEQEILSRQLLAKRMRKRLRKHERMARRYGS